MPGGGSSRSRSPATTPLALAQTAAWLPRKSSRTKAMGRAARERVETSGWTWEAAAAATDEAYAELLEA